MSTTQPTEYTCDRENCAETFSAGSGYNGHCSAECCHSRRGENLLNILKYDHRFCHGDFTRLKEVSRPTDEQLRQIQGRHSAEAVVGYQYKTPSADVGELTFVPREDRTEIVGTGVVCGNCGTTDHRDDFQRDFSIQEAAKRLKKRLEETRAEGQHDKDFDTEAFVEAWNESNDWEYSVGVAIQE